MVALLISSGVRYFRSAIAELCLVPPYRSPASASDSTRAAMLTPSPYSLPSSAMTSPRFTPIQNCILPVFRKLGIPFSKISLDFHSTIDGIYNAGKLSQYIVTWRIDNTATVLTRNRRKWAQKNPVNSSFLGRIAYMR